MTSSVSWLLRHLLSLGAVSRVCQGVRFEPEKIGRSFVWVGVWWCLCAWVVPHLYIWWRSCPTTFTEEKSKEDIYSFQADRHPSNSGILIVDRPRGLSGQCMSQWIASHSTITMWLVLLPASWKYNFPPLKHCGMHDMSTMRTRSYEAWLAVFLERVAPSRGQLCVAAV